MFNKSFYHTVVKSDQKEDRKLEKKEVKEKEVKVREIQEESGVSEELLAKFLYKLYSNNPPLYCAEFKDLRAVDSSQIFNELKSQYQIIVTQITRWLKDNEIKNSDNWSTFFNNIFQESYFSTAENANLLFSSIKKKLETILFLLSDQNLLSEGRKKAIMDDLTQEINKCCPGVIQHIDACYNKLLAKSSLPAVKKIFVERLAGAFIEKYKDQCFPGETLQGANFRNQEGNRIHYVRGLMDAVAQDYGITRSGDEFAKAFEKDYGEQFRNYIEQCSTNSPFVFADIAIEQLLLKAEKIKSYDDTYYKEFIEALEQYGEDKGFISSAIFKLDDAQEECKPVTCRLKRTGQSVELSALRALKFTILQRMQNVGYITPVFSNIQLENGLKISYCPTEPEISRVITDEASYDLLTYLELANDYEIKKTSENECRISIEEIEDEITKYNNLMDEIDQKELKPSEKVKQKQLYWQKKIAIFADLSLLKSNLHKKIISVELIKSPLTQNLWVSRSRFWESRRNAASLRASSP